MVQQKGINGNGEQTATYTHFSFTGQPLKIKRVQGANTEVLDYTYDHADRLLTTVYRLNNDPAVTLTDNVYDEIGRLITDRRNGNANLKTDYAYNLRSWVKSITSPLFTQTLYYQENISGNTPCYNGNISSMLWKTSKDAQERGYRFTYDNLSRMKNAVYGEGSTLAANVERFNEQITGYDKMGNILGLLRYGQTGASTYGLIDNLNLTYNGNQLQAVSDNATNSVYGNGMEFKDGATATTEYEYDKNGNLTKDLNKNISTIEYNCLNLPSRVTFANGDSIRYEYAADGTKLRTVHTIGGTTTTTDYCGNAVYENGVLKMLLNDAGYVSFPDGGLMSNATGNDFQKYKYNGKELDRKAGLNWYDYGARFYDPAIGRFTTNDRFSEKYYPMSTYQYGANNPAVNIDVNGDSIVVLNYTEGEHLGMLIQDESQQWRYYSFNGDKIYNFTDGSSGGGPIDNKGEMVWNSPQDFMDDDYNQATNNEDLENGIVNGYGYKEGYLIPTTREQDEIITQTYLDAIQQGYSLIGNHCSIAVQKALNAANIGTYDLKAVTNRQFGEISKVKINPYLPSAAYRAIKRNNPSGYLIKRR